MGLVITLKLGEEVFINDGEIRLTVSSVKGRYVKILFDADKNKTKISRVMPHKEAPPKKQD